MPSDSVILEIGGGYNPRFIKDKNPNVYHLDHDTAEALRTKYAAIPETRDNIGNIPPVIDFVFDGSPIDTLIPTSLRFDLVYGRHVLEHQVDLIGHLNSLEKIVKPSGSVIQIIPDLRATFDALRYPTVTSDALMAHGRREGIHRGKQLFDFTSRLINKNPGHRMCDADLIDVQYAHEIRESLAAMHAAEGTNQSYEDAHAWAFTPNSFKLLMIELRLLQLTNFSLTFLSPTYGNQFCAVMKLSNKDSSQLTSEERQSLDKERVDLALSLRVK